jgi:hypothetical protein
MMMDQKLAGRSRAAQRQYRRGVDQKCGAAGIVGRTVKEGFLGELARELVKRERETGRERVCVCEEGNRGPGREGFPAFGMPIGTETVVNWKSGGVLHIPDLS